MHIGKKIIEDILSTLQSKYSIWVDHNEWDLFEKPLPINIEGKIDKTAFKERQDKSINIITKILDVHGKADIVRFLGRLASIEPKIQALQPHIRDHVVHAINTFISGVYILEHINFPLFRSARVDYPFIWKLCGPTHDLGYPIEIAYNVENPIVKEMNDILDGLHSPSPRGGPEAYPEYFSKLCEEVDANEIIQRRLTDWALGIDIEEYYDWLKKKHKTDHGIISALIQLKVIDALYYEVNPRREYRDIIKDNLNFNQTNFDLDIVSASTALFIHNIDLNYYGFSNKISFDISPLAFLLFLCDTFQEWDRYSESKTVYSGNDFDINCTHNSISLFVPYELEQKIFGALYQRLSGLLVRVNGRVAVS